MIFIMSCCIQHLIGTCILGYRYLWQSVWLLFFVLHKHSHLKNAKMTESCLSSVCFLSCHNIHNFTWADVGNCMQRSRAIALQTHCYHNGNVHFKTKCILNVEITLHVCIWDHFWIFFFYFSWFEGMQNSLAISKDFKIVDLFLFLSKITETLCLFCIFRNYILYELENALLCPMTNKRPGNMFTDFLFSCFFTGKDVLCYAVW